MVDYLLLVASQVVTLFLLMGVGFFLGKKRKISAAGLSDMTYLLLYAVTGCIIIQSMQIDRDMSLLRELGICAAIMTGLYLLYALLAVPLFRRQQPDSRAALQFGSVYGNTGFMGLPLILGVLGERALIYASVSFVVFTVFNWIHGVILMGGRKAFSVKKALLNPGTIGLFIGLPLFLLDFRLPSMVGGAVDFLASMNTPLAMVVIGAQMSNADLPSTFRQIRLYQAALFKLLFLPLVTALILLPLHLNPLFYSTVVILAATPTAGATAMFSQQFGRDTQTAGQLVTLTTLLSVVTLPLFAVLAELLG